MVGDERETVRPADVRARSTVRPADRRGRSRRLMIRTFLDLRVKPGHAERLAAAFERLAILDESVAQSGCSSADLSVSADGSTVTVTATWDSTEAYAAWTLPRRSWRPGRSAQRPPGAATRCGDGRSRLPHPRQRSTRPTDGQRGTATMSDRSRAGPTPRYGAEARGMTPTRWRRRAADRPSSTTTGRSDRTARRRSGAGCRSAHRSG